MSTDQPGPQPRSQSQSLHTSTVRIPFLTHEHAQVAKRSLQVDREQNAGLIERVLEIQGTTLIVTYHAASVRLLRLCTNAFLSSIDLVLRTMGEFALDPDAPELTKEELGAAKDLGSSTSGKGIELKDDREAGSGEEVA